MLKKIRTSLVASAIGITFALGNAHAVVPASSFSGVVIFGDSLSDTGNVLSLTTAFAPAPFPTFPGAHGRFSNGAAWTEYLADGLGFASSANPSNLLFDGTNVVPIGATGGRNFAYGGARTGLGGSAGGTTGLLGQLVAWDNSASILGGGPLTRPADPDALYVVVAGANDLRDFRSGVAGAANPTTVAGNVVSALGLLANAGARNFLISTLPDLGLTPEAVGLGVAAESTAATLDFNGALSSLAGSFEAGFNQANSVDLDIRTLDFYGLFNKVADDANNHGGATYGITNISTACINKGPFSGEYFFADATTTACGTAGFSDPLHPSAKSHELLGALALTTVTAVPEPSEFALMIGGLLLIGGFVRRRAKAA